MLNWRNGKAGFVGGLKYLIKGVFRYAHTVTTADVITQGPGEGTNGSITDNGIGLSGLINSDGIGQNGIILLGFGASSIISDNGIGKTGLINNDGIGKNGDI